MNFETAISFVRQRGNEVEKARLAYLLTGERPSAEIVAQLFAGQQPDGGWSPFWVKDYTSLDATCFRLAQAEQLGLGRSETTITRAVDFLAERQAQDGSWEEDKKVANLAPPWAAPGDPEATLYLTANCGLWLALLGDPDNRASKAAGFLQSQLGPDGHLPSFLHTHWLAGTLWHKLGWQPPAERAFKYLSERINELDASNLSWWIITACVAGIPPNQSVVGQAASLLEKNQRGDGCWPSEDGPESDVHSTLEAMRALWLCGRIDKKRNDD